MERPVGSFLRDEMVATVLLHPNQHADQAGKFMETALHQLVVQVEEELDQQETALGVFLDKEGAFNLLMPNVNYSGHTAPLTSKVAFFIFIQQI